MTDPATGTAAASTAAVMTTGTMWGLSQFLPPGSSPGEFLWGIAFAMLGAFAFQFVEALAARQAAAEKNVPIAERPTIDLVMLGYALFAAPLSAAFLILFIHEYKGATGFGDLTFVQSAAGFMAAGAVGHKIVIKLVAAIVSLIGLLIDARLGGKPK